MTVPTTTNKVIATGNGVSTIFPFTYGTLPPGDLVVTLYGLDGIAIPQVENSDYTVQGKGDDDGGSITFSVAPPNGYTVLIQRIVPITQPTDYKNQGSFYPRTHERSFDRAAMIDQQQQERIDAALTLPPQITGVSTTLPTPQSLRLIGWNEASDSLRNFTVSEIGTTLAFSNFIADTFTAGVGQASFNLSADPGVIENLDVSVDGVTQVPNVDYILINATITFTTPMAGGEKVLARYGTALPTGITAANAILYTPPSTGILGTVKSFLDSLWTAGASYGADLIRFLQAGAGAVARTAQDKNREWVSVKDFGAVGNGTTDDGPAFQAAINYALTKLNGGSVYVPAAKYKIGTQVTIPIQSNKGKVLFGDGAGSILEIGSVSGGLHGFYVGAASAAGNINTLFEKLMFEGGGTTGKAVRLQNGNTGRFKDCYFNNMDIAVDSSDSFAVRFHGCIFESVASYCYVSSTSSHHLTFDHCNWYDCGQVAGGFGTCVKLGAPTDNVVFRDCDFEGNNRVLVRDGGSSHLFDGCYIENGLTAVISEGANVVYGFDVINCWLSNNPAWNISQVEGGTLDNNKINAQVITFDANTVRNFDVGTNRVVNGSSVAAAPFWPVTSFSNGYTGTNVGYKKHKDGTVELRGILTLGTNNNMAFNLPSGYRPAFTMNMSALSTANGAGAVIIDANGNVVPGTGGANLNLNGIRFSVQ